MTGNEKKKLVLALSVVPCPNCGGTFHFKDDPLAVTNIRCDKCNFEAIYQLMEGAERQLAFTIEKEDAERLMAERRTVPPVILHWTWELKDSKFRMEAVDLYPFIPHTFLKRADVSLSLSGQPNKELVFLQSDELLPKMRIHENPANDEEVAIIVSEWGTVNTSAIQRFFGYGYSRAARIVDLARKIRRKKGYIDPEPEPYDDEDEE